MPSLILRTSSPVSTGSALVPLMTVVVCLQVAGLDQEF
jgi:hypothetical protein